MASSKDLKQEGTPAVLGSGLPPKVRRARGSSDRLRSCHTRRHPPPGRTDACPAKGDGSDRSRSRSAVQANCSTTGRHRSRSWSVDEDRGECRGNDFRQTANLCRTRTSAHRSEEVTLVAATTVPLLNTTSAAWATRSHFRGSRPAVDDSVVGKCTEEPQLSTVCQTAGATAPP